MNENIISLLLKPQSHYGISLNKALILKSLMKILSSLRVSVFLKKLNLSNLKKETRTHTHIG